MHVRFNILSLFLEIFSGMRFIFLIWFISILSTTNLFAQENPLLEKYFDYRLRLENYFIKSDESAIVQNAGYGMPAATLQYPADCLSDWEVTGSDCGGAVSGNQKLHWADGTYVLGDYIAMLATEYGLYKKSNAGADAEQTAFRILQALHTIERLELEGNVLTGAAGEPKQGWFVRDDVPGDFHQQWDTVSCITSAGTCGVPSPLKGYFTSQDQVSSLLFGLAFVRRFVDENLEIAGINLRQKASAIAHRMVTYMQQNEWKLISPDGIEVPDEYGGNAFFLSWGFSSAASYITDSVYLSIPDDAVPYWLFQNMPVLDPYSSEPDSICIFGFCFEIIGKDYNNAMILKLAAAGNERNDTTMSLQSQQFGHWIYPIARAVIHDTIIPEFDEEAFHNLLLQAPADGPCYNPSGDPAFDCNAEEGWWSTDRWVRTSHAIGLDENQRRGRFNGIDFMLAYNLYHLYFTPHLPYIGTLTNANNHRPAISDLSIFPNPVVDYLQVHHTSFDPEVQWQIFNSSAQLVSAGTGIDHPVNVNHLPPAVYTFCVQNQPERICTRFVKMP